MVRNRTNATYRAYHGSRFTHKDRNNVFQVHLLLHSCLRRHSIRPVDYETEYWTGVAKKTAQHGSDDQMREVRNVHNSAQRFVDRGPRLLFQIVRSEGRQSVVPN